MTVKTGRSVGSTCFLCRGAWLLFNARTSHWRTTRTNDQINLHRLGISAGCGDLLNACVKVVLDHISHKAIRCKNTQVRIGIVRLQWSNPGVELLLRQFRLELREATVPKLCAQQPDLRGWMMEKESRRSLKTSTETTTETHISSGKAIFEVTLGESNSTRIT